MLVWKEASWTNGKETVTGKWAYIYESDSFFISLKNGETRRTYRDEPEWGSFKLIRKNNEAS